MKLNHSHLCDICGKPRGAAAGKGVSHDACSKIRQANRGELKGESERLRRGREAQANYARDVFRFE